VHSDLDDETTPQRKPFALSPFREAFQPQATSQPSARLAAMTQKGNLDGAMELRREGTATFLLFREVF
jgi:hypothetical protein